MRSLTYDFENRLASYTTASTTANYLYDPQGRRLQKTVNSVVTRYLWDGATMIAELDGTNHITRLYTYNPQSMEPVSTAIGCTAYFYITDHLMTPQMLTSMSDTTVWYAQYSAFGTATISTDTVTNNLRFPGQYVDAESGLNYNVNRYYSPTIGRFIEADPIFTNLLFFSQIWPYLKGMFDNIEVDRFTLIISPNAGINLYIYGQDNPVHWGDWLGLTSAVYDPGTGTITVINGNGNVIGQYPAGNNVVGRGNSSIPSGSYPVGPPRSNNDPNRFGHIPSEGPGFLPIYGAPNGANVGVHGDRQGPLSPTFGCIRMFNSDYTDVPPENQSTCS